MAAADPGPRSGATKTSVGVDDGERHVASDQGICPLCGGPNDCAIANDDRQDEACWCVGHRFSDKLFAQIPSKDLGRRCVCPRCAFGETAQSRQRDAV